MEYSRREIRVFILTIVAIVAGPVMVWSSIGKLYTAVRSKSWPAAEGEIFDAQVRMSSGRRSRFVPQNTYGYKVDGKEYTSEQLSHGDPESFSNQFEAAAAARKFVPGSHVTVYHDPKDPKQSVLQTGAAASNWLVLAIGIVVTAAGVFGARGYWRSLQTTTLKPRSGSGF
jgi:hypothetical protein